MTEDQKRIAALAQEFDVLCDVDFHERAAEYAAAIGKDEPGEYEYYAAVRDGLDELRASVQPSAVPAGPQNDAQQRER